MTMADNPMSIFDISGRAMSAQLARLNTTASNLANAGSVSGSRATAYRALRPVFTVAEGAPGVATVDAGRIVRTNVEPTRRHDPDHPLADANGDVWVAGVDTAAEMILGLPGTIPPNDGGLAAGQLAIGIHFLEKRRS